MLAVGLELKPHASCSIARVQCLVQEFKANLGECDESVQVSAAPGVTFHPKGIAANNALESKGESFTSISKSMEELGITWLDILKIDIEGSEWDVFLEMIENGMNLPFTQVLIGKLHYVSLPLAS